MISPDTYLAFWGQTLEELWLLWLQFHVASRTHRDSSRAGLAETPHVQDPRRLVTSRTRGDSSRAGLAETRHEQDLRRLVTSRTRGDSSWGSGRSIGTWSSIVHCVTLVRITGTIWFSEITTTKLCTLLVGVCLCSLTSGRCRGSYSSV